MTFDKAAAKALFDAMQSHALATGLFRERVNVHAPLNEPGNDVSAWITLGRVRPVMSSGLAAVSIEVTFVIHVTSSLLQKPLDGVDPAVLGAVSVLLAAYAGNFTLGGLVREVSIFGGLQAQPGYMDFGGKPLRAVEITVPVIVNDAWNEAP